ncbi:MAG TPA: PAS domain S-box protein, partial [Thermoanaerobaculia bacterium]|nr:PAS domain S-box protein [Thermoanaerobaculia bacterium]
LDSLALRVVHSLAETAFASRAGDLQSQLTHMAQRIAELPGMIGVMVVAFDEEGKPLTSGLHNLSLIHRGSLLEGLLDLRQRLSARMSEPSWFGTLVCRSSRPGRTLALPIREAGSAATGLILAAVEPRASQTLQALAQETSILAAAIRCCIRNEAWNRNQKLLQLARETFEKQEPDLRGLVKELARLFKAGAVTLFLEEQDELRLAVSTDPHLGEEGPVVYPRGKGLTGYVFKTGQPLRLSNTEDPVEVAHLTDIERTGPSYPERDEDGLFTGQFLGVPLRFGGKVVGVLRMSSREGVARFTLEDEKALQFFADLLAGALARSWELLLARSILESVNEAIAVTRRDDERGMHVPRLIMANQGAEKLFGRTKEELRGMDARDVYAPEEYDKIKAGLTAALRAAPGQDHGEYGPVDSRIRRPDGSVVPVRISFRHLSNHLVQSPSLFTIGIARDMSESERLAEQHRRLLELLDTMDIAYFEVDADDRTRVSAGAESRILGFSRESLSSRPRQSLFVNPRLRRRLFQKARAQKGKTTRGVLQMRRADGTPFWAEGDLRILEDSEGRQTGAAGFYRDVTERIRLQGFLDEDIQTVLSEHELLARLKADAEFHLDYLTSLGHQLQTPLSSLVETLRNLEKGVKSTERLPYVIGQAIVCNRLVRNLSYMDKILRGEPFQKETVSLGKLVMETKYDFLHLLREKKMELVVDQASLERFLVIQGHREMLRQVLVNLVDNAIKYSFSESTIVVVGRKRSDGVALEISNAGFPISEEDRDKIFQRGFRTPRAQALIPYGTGFGLWLVRKIVEAHDATIRCHEVMEGGQKRVLFRIVFPNAKLVLRRSS